MTLTGALLTLSPIISLWIGALMAFFGLLFAPVAAIYCSRLARRNGLSPKRYAIMGGVYSLMFFVPAVYLIARLRGRIASRKVIRIAYIIVYFYWILGPIGLAFLMAIIGGGGEMFLALLLLIIASAWHIIHTDQEAWRMPKTLSPPVIPGYAYLAPFLLAYLSSIASILFLFVANSRLEQR